jgi:hypothetical protein
MVDEIPIELVDNDRTFCDYWTCPEDT